METIDDLLSQHPFFTGLKSEYLGLISGCGQNVHFDAGAYPTCRFRLPIPNGFQHFHDQSNIDVLN